ncbi:acyl-CoA dehydrogenase family protein [Corynebacterium glyciniphilum]|uniref:acyl-CoA dehydrogenase family protein n=1 Tax=Corynebacterium glyciniphilum TaxID=1404244 RepID=UPI0011AB7290|nr:acyl-CoA dehydrogenase family protein [Corynebacterium glyciniphilum]
MFAPRTEEQDQFQAVVRDFFATVSSETLVRQAMDSDTGYDPQVWDRMARELQLQGIAVPEEFGGQGFGWTELGIVLEEAGAALLCAPYFATTVLAGMTVLESGDTAAQQEILPGIADGSLIGTLAFPGENRRWDESGVTVTAQKSGDDWTVSGTCPGVIDGQNAGVFIVPARTGHESGDGISLFIVRVGDGVTTQGLSTLDPTRRVAHLRFDHAPATPLGDDEGWDQVSRILDLASVGLAAEQVGVARRALEDAVAYMKERVQFGQAIGEFQALKHMAADVLVDVESAASASRYALWAAQDAPEELPASASLAAGICTDVAVTATHQNIQFHGGMGFTWEASPHLYLKRARADQVLFGDAQFHRANLARRIGAGSTPEAVR